MYQTVLHHLSLQVIISVFDTKNADTVASNNTVSANRTQFEVIMTADSIFSQEMAMTLLESEEEYPVDFEVAWVWLGYSKKSNAKAMLVKNFVENEDFRLLKIQQSAPSGV